MEGLFWREAVFLFLKGDSFSSLHAPPLRGLCASLNIILYNFSKPHSLVSLFLSVVMMERERRAKVRGVK